MVQPPATLWEALLSDPSFTAFMNSRSVRVGYFIEGLDTVLHTLVEQTTRLIEQNPTDAGTPVETDGGPMTLSAVRDRAREFHEIITGMLGRTSTGPFVEKLAELENFSENVNQFCLPAHGSPTPATREVTETAARLTDYAIALAYAYESYNSGRQSLLAEMHEAFQQRSGHSQGRGR